MQNIQLAKKIYDQSAIIKGSTVRVNSGPKIKSKSSNYSSIIGSQNGQKSWNITGLSISGTEFSLNSNELTLLCKF